MSAERPAGAEVAADVTTELIPDLTTELAEAAVAPHRAEHEAAEVEPDVDPETEWVAVYDTRLERYVAGRMTLAEAEDHGYSKTGRYRLHGLDTGAGGGLVGVTGP